jgi:hypothetical protein
MNQAPPVVPIWQEFEFHGAAGSNPVDHFECRLDEGAWSICTSPWSPDLIGGDHGIAVRAVDTTGLADPTPEPAEFFVDVDPPIVSMTINRGTVATARYIVELNRSYVERSSVDEILVSNSPELDAHGRLANASAGTDWDVATTMEWRLDQYGGTAQPGLHTV